MEKINYAMKVSLRTQVRGGERESERSQCIAIESLTPVCVIAAQLENSQHTTNHFQELRRVVGYAVHQILEVLYELCHRCSALKEEMDVAF